MTGTQLFVLMAAIYLAPHVSKKMGGAIGMFCLALAIVEMVSK